MFAVHRCVIALQCQHHGARRRSTATSCRLYLAPRHSVEYLLSLPQTTTARVCSQKICGEKSLPLRLQPQQIIADSLQRRLLLMTESAAVLPEIAGYTNCCWFTQVATLAGACLQFAYEDHTQICRSVIFANFLVMCYFKFIYAVFLRYLSFVFFR